MTGRDADEFCFDLKALSPDPRRDFIATLPKGLSGRGPLFTVLRQALKLPDYFGGNWDALRDCLRTLDWINARRVILVHQDLPRLPPADLAAYLEILSEAVREWEPTEAHAFRVVFPPGALG